MTSKGSLQGQLRRAIASGNLLTVRAIAAELEFVPLDAALDITLLIQRREPSRFDAAACRWLSRFLRERPIVSIDEAAAAAAALALLSRERREALRRLEHTRALL